MAGRGKQKKRFTKKKINFRKPLAIVAGSVFFVLIVGAGFSLTFDVNSYRDQIASVLSRQLGREIALEGRVAWGFSFDHGLSLRLFNVKIGNPKWAAHPLMAQAGQISLHLAPLPLWNRKLDITSLRIVRADYQAEIGPDGSGNWVFRPEKDKPVEEEIIFFTKKRQSKKPRSLSMSVSIRKVEILDSRFGLKRADGRVDVFEIPLLLLEQGQSGTHAHYKGFVNGVPFEADLSGGPLADLSGEKWPFSLEALYAGARFTAKGYVKDRMARAVLDDFSVVAGQSKAVGQIEVSFDGARPCVRGRIESPFFDFSALRFHKTPGREVATFVTDSLSALERRGRQPLFSPEPIDMDIFRVFDADFTLEAGQIVWGLTSFYGLETKVSQKDGHALLSPFAVSVAGSKVRGAVKIDASGKEAKIAAALKGAGLEFSKLFNLGGVESMIAGKVDLDFDVRTEGRSPRDFASHADGDLSLLMDTGTLSSSALRNLAGGVADFLFPGARQIMNPGINCMAARYKIKNGFVETKGFLLDMDASTIAGVGTINLPDEHINMNMRTRPKGVGLGAIVPPMRIYGNLTSPDVSFDTGKAIQKVAGALTGANAADTSVPTILHIEGRNDCAVTLDNPSLASATAAGRASAPLSPGGDRGTITGVIKSLGGRLIQGIGEKLFGE